MKAMKTLIAGMTAGSTIGSRPSINRAVRMCVCVFVVSLFIACRQDMQNQPKYKPLRPMDPFGSITDGRSSRPLVSGTVARGQLREDFEFFTGKTVESQNAAARASQQSSAATVVAPPAPVQPPPATGSQAPSYQGFVTAFPLSVDRELLDRGEERFNIYCSVCHGRTGMGDGMVARRGFKRPPSFHEERLRTAPPGYLFDVITNGFGAMPDYSTQISAHDRWAIVAFVRALQLSRQATISDVPAAEREKLNSAMPREGQR